MDRTPSDWDTPAWDQATRVHDWKNCVSEDIRRMWASFTADQKKALARQADEHASGEVWD